MKRILIEVLLLVILSSFVVLFQFNQLPKKLSFDEIEFTRLALSLENKPYITYSELATGHATLYFYILLTSFKLLGINSFALRLPSALFGIMNVILFYFIAGMVFSRLDYFKKSFFHDKLPIIKISFSSFLPFLLSFIFITLRWYFNFTRFSFEVTFLLFLELSAILFFFLFLREKKIHHLILTGLFSGLAFHSYYPGRIFFVLPLLFLFLYSKKNLVKKSITIYLITFIITTSPLWTYLFTHKDIRFQEQLFLANKKLSLSKKVSYIGENTLRLLGMFNIRGDWNGRHNYPGKPIVNPFIGVFFILGLLVAMVNIRNFNNQFFLVYFLLGLVPAMLTYPNENPNSLRSYTAVIPFVYFVGSGMVYLLQSESNARKLYLFTVGGVVMLSLLGAAYDIRTYYVYQKKVFNRSFELPGSINLIFRMKLWEKIGYL